MHILYIIYILIIWNVLTLLFLEFLFFVFSIFALFIRWFIYSIYWYWCIRYIDVRHLFNTLIDQYIWLWIRHCNHHLASEFITSKTSKQFHSQASEASKTMKIVSRVTSRRSLLSEGMDETVILTVLIPQVFCVAQNRFKNRCLVLERHPLPRLKAVNITDGYQLQSIHLPRCVHSFGGGLLLRWFDRSCFALFLHVRLSIANYFWLNSF